jgi:hypothetical protein
MQIALATKLINQVPYKLWAEPCERQSAVAVPMHIFGRLIALFGTKPSQGLAMIDS